MKDEAGLMQKEGGYHEWSDIRYYGKTKDKKVKRRMFECYQKPVKQGNTYEIDDLYDASRYYQKWQHIRNHQDTILEPEELFVNLIKDFPEEILAEVEDKDSIFESYQTDEMDGFEDLEKDKSPGVSFKNNREILSSDSPPELPLEAWKEEVVDLDDKGVHDSVQDSAVMDCTSRMKLNKVNIENDNSDNKKKKKTVLIETEEIVDGKTQKENNCRALTEDKEESIEGWHNSKRSLNEDTLDRACEAWSTGKAHKILEWFLKFAESSAGRIGTKNVKKKEVKRVKIETNLESVGEFENNHIQLEDQFQGTMEEIRKSLIYLYLIERKAIQNIEDNENSKIVMSRIGDESMNAADMDNEIVDHLFDPGGKCLLKHSFRP
ncbi:23355_t:CDS:2 [Gigaspora margarita]|uniref:23355_t:CDS:1 n=1 Tax=Gigaspora margarita TaxID=4874 RepID=A0ABM8W6R7_GIGMA|nr:23355_t:CDS:2 [Gigaspora margarita]